MNIQLIDVETNSRPAQFGTCELCFRYGQVNEPVFVFDVDGSRYNIDGYKWSYGDYEEFEIDAIELADYVNNHQFDDYEYVEELLEDIIKNQAYGCDSKYAIVDRTPRISYSHEGELRDGGGRLNVTYHNVDFENSSNSELAASLKVVDRHVHELGMEELQSLIDLVEWIGTEESIQKRFQKILNECYYDQAAENEVEVAQVPYVPDTTKEPSEYTMVYRSRKGEQEYHFLNGARHKNIVVGDMETARDYARAKADAWKVKLLNVQNNVFGQALQDLGDPLAIK